MKLPRLTLDPITRKRLRRFRARRRAWVSLWILLALYAASLASELICNERPLVLRFNGRTFFPALRYYPEDTFLGNGKLTRPDYKKLCAAEAFLAAPGNFAVFAPVPFGPYETIDPESLRPEERVSVVFDRIPRVGSVDLLPDGSIESAAAAGHFFGAADDTVAGLPLQARWRLTDDLRQAIERRFRNEPSPAISRRLEAGGVEADLSLSAFTVRSRPPRIVRLTFREPDAGRQGRESASFDRDARAVGPMPAVWSRLDPATRTAVEDGVRRRFEEPVPETLADIGESRYRIRWEKNDIRWPYPPVRGHWLGIDSAGRDVLARILYGLRISMTFGFLLVIASTAVGTLIGAVQGYYGGRIDLTGQRLIEIWSALPFFYVMILLGSIYGRSFALLLFLYGIFNWIGISYYMRAEFLRLRHLPFVDSARCLGVPSSRIMIRHILPNALTPIITFFPFSLVGAIGSLAALDYLGFGLPPPTPSWGELLAQAQAFRWAWWLILYPSLALFAVMLFGVFVGEGIRDAYDPKPYTRME